MTTTTNTIEWNKPTGIRNDSRVACAEVAFGLIDNMGREIGCFVTIHDNTTGLWMRDGWRKGEGFSICVRSTRNRMTFGAGRYPVGEYATLAEAKSAAVKAVARSQKAKGKKYADDHYCGGRLPIVTEAAPAAVEAAPAAPAAPVAPAAVEAEQAPTSAQLAQMAQIAAPGFMVYDSTDTIIGVGVTVDDAVADAGERTEQTLPLAMIEPGTFDSEPGRLYLLPITDSLLQQLLHAPRLDALGFTVIAHGARPLIADIVR